MNLMTIGLLAQGIGTVLLVGSYIPQIGKLHKTKNPMGISLLFWIMITTGCLTILANMFIQHAPSEVKFTQLLNAIGALYTLILAVVFRKVNGMKMNQMGKKSTVVIVIAIIALVVFAIYEFKTLPLQQFGNVLQSIGSIALLTAYLPQYVHLFKVKDATGVSKWLFFVIGFGLLCVTINMIITGTNKGIIATEFFNIALIFGNYAQTVYYQKLKK